MQVRSQRRLRDARQPGSSVQLAVLDQVAAPKLVVLDTMNFGWTWPDNLKKIIARVDVLTVNDEEARQLTGEHFLPKTARAIRMGPKTVVIKKGEHGALMFQDDKVFFAPAFPLEKVVDPTAATPSREASSATWPRVTKRQAKCLGRRHEAGSDRGKRHGQLHLQAFGTSGRALTERTPSAVGRSTRS